ncbi:peptidoglycan DD-metalloendopeptidase family protein [Ningiella sp. W23]|uniref:peptidoglycan DD-metalloendopeptidase family protein n=1 Tax=Ningiella sp. W23 TaxID=3023715 RepID=UPI00375644BC
MKITILVKGRSTRIAKRFSMKRLVSICVLLSVMLLASSRHTESLYENHLRVNTVTTGLKEQARLLAQLQKATDEKVDGMVTILGDMQAKLHYLDTLSATLAEQNDLVTEDFVLDEDIQRELNADFPLRQKLETASKALDYKIKQLEALESILLGLNVEYNLKIAGRPVEKGWLSSHYGMRKHPLTEKVSMHKGVDFAGKEGSNVVATGAGIVVWASKRTAYGYLVEIDHGNGYKTRYGHNKEIKVKVGDVVTKGQTIATMGSSGRSTGVHVHYEVLKHGRHLDPLPYIYQ